MYATRDGHRPRVLPLQRARGLAVKSEPSSQSAIDDSATADCCSEDTLVAYGAGLLPAEQMGLVREHLRSCERCTSTLYVSAIADASAGPPATGRSINLRNARDAESLAQALLQASGAAPLAPAWSELPVTIDEFRLEALLGQGAMGRVYRAWDTQLGRAVAFKLPLAQSGSQRARADILAEAKALAQIQHPNVVSCYQAGLYAGFPYVVFELVDGQSLAELPLPVPFDKLMKIALDLASGLSAAHRNGVLHRDIKPANAVMAADGVVKLVDFGLALHLTAERAVADSFAAGQHLTHGRTGAIVGTPAFMAPEQWRGEPASAASDLYSLGALLYMLWSGHPPHQARDYEDLRISLERNTPEPLPAHNQEEAQLARIVMRCLERNPQDRFASAEELNHTLVHIKQDRAAPRAWIVSVSMKLTSRARGFVASILLGWLCSVSSDYRSHSTLWSIVSCDKPDSFCSWHPVSDLHATQEGYSAMAATTLLPGDLWLAGHPGTPDGYNKRPRQIPRAGVIVHVKPTGESVSYALDARIWDIAGFLDKTVPGNPASQTLYAVGDGGIYGYHNKKWSKESPDNGTGVWVSPTGEAWAVGSTSIGDERNPYILNRDSNGNWRAVDASLLSQEHRTLHAIVGDREKIFASGKNGLLVEFDRASAVSRIIELPNKIGNQASMFALAINENGELFMTAAYYNPQIYSYIVRYDYRKKEFSHLPIMGRAVFGLWLNPSSQTQREIWVTGDYAPIWRCNFDREPERACDQVVSDLPISKSLRSLFGSGPNDLWAVGYDRGTPRAELIRYHP